MHTPERRCRVCRQRFPKTELVRWLIEDGRLVRDENQKGQARGVYSCLGACSEQILSKPLRVLR